MKINLVSMNICDDTGKTTELKSFDLNRIKVTVHKMQNKDAYQAWKKVVVRLDRLSDADIRKHTRNLSENTSVEARKPHINMKSTKRKNPSITTKERGFEPLNKYATRSKTQNMQANFEKPSKNSNKADTVQTQICKTTKRRSCDHLQDYSTRSKRIKMEVAKETIVLTSNDMVEPKAVQRSHYAPTTHPNNS